MWRAWPPLLRWPRTFSTTTQILRAKTAYEAKLAARKPPPALLETDLEESFIKGGSPQKTRKLTTGGGPGGQKINKSSSCVQLRHIPTAIVIKCQESRSLQENRQIARKWLIRKLDVLENGEESIQEIKKWNVQRKKSSREKKSRRKYRKLEKEKVAKKRKAEETVD
jgi:peptide chain release factor